MADSRIDELRRRLERDPASRLFAQLAEEHRKAGDHAEAIRVARAGLALHPAYPSARLTLGRALLDSGDAGGARTELEAALRDAPDNILASRFLGLALEALGEHGPALLQLQKTLKMAPGDRQLEAQVAALQAQGGVAPRAAPPPRPAAGATPGAARAAAGAAAVGEEDEDLPATILIYNRDDPGASGRRRAAPVAEPVAEPAPAPAAPPAGPVPVTPPAEPAPATPVPNGPPLEWAEAPESAGPVETAAPTLPAGALSVEETVFEHEGAPEPVPAGPGVSASARAWAEDAAAASPAPAVVEEAPPFSSSTLAELYFRQGLIDRAVEVYRQLLVEEPGNDRARSRLAELEAARPADPRTARRRALERTIAGLEALLDAVRARRA